MCVDPATVAMIGMGVQAVGTVTSMAGAAQNAQATAQASLYSAQVARNNQMIAEQNAQYATAKGEQGAEVRQLQGGQMRGTARAMMGASGVKIDGGIDLSPVRVQGDIAMITELDTQTIRNNALREAYGHRVQGMGFGAAAGLDTMKADSALRAGGTNVLTSLISGASGIADKWSKFRTVNEEIAT